MLELIIATKNKGKLTEIKELLKDLPLKITSLTDYPNIPPIEEDGLTYAQNAIKKAATIAMYTNKLTLGEDSGLEVGVLNKRPGIYSARFTGKDATDKKNNQKLLKSLKNIPFKKRTARYQCYAALVDGKKIIDVVGGSCAGVISIKLRGTNGFGYDPLFLIPRYNKTFGELDPAIKSKISHRARALRKIKMVLRKYLEK